MAYHLDEVDVSVGNLAPDFEAHTASGLLQYHEWVEDSWSIIFSHPGTSFPLELLEVARQFAEFDKRNVKLIGVSGSWLNDQRKWKASQVRYGIKPGSIDKKVQVVADDAGEIASIYGMAADEGDPKAEPNTVFVIDPNRIIRIALGYPATFRKNADKLLLFIDRYSTKSRESSPQIDPTTLTRSRTDAGRSSTARSPLVSRDITPNSSGYVTPSSNTPEPITHTNGTRTRSLTTTAAADRSSPLVPARPTDIGFAGTASNALPLQTVAGISLASLHPPSPSPSSPGGGGGNYIQNAINTLDSIVDIGKVLPFVAPAFIMLKLIIEVEKSAQETSLKCQDLVIDRMNNVLKECTALIEAYRKQGVIARRLRMGNKDKFEGCAKALALVTNDLMVSLQVYQTAKMAVVDRVVPKEEGEEEAEAFVKEYGGEDTVRRDRELVAMFVEDMKMEIQVDQNLMDELKIDVVDAVQDQHRELERRLNEGIVKAMLEDQREREKEQTFVCVQCDKEYKDSTSGDKSCSYHRAEYDSWNRTWPCCSTKNPCQSGAHRAQHHCEYPYGAFFPFARNIYGYTDTLEEWASVEDTNLETDDTQYAQISELLRWKSHGAEPSEPTILIRVGRCYFKYPYYFQTFTAKDLELQSRVIDITKQTVIFRTSSSDSEYAMAEWVISDSLDDDTERAKITGVRITAKVASCLHPYIRVCLFDDTTCRRSGDTITISEGGFRSYTPATPYTLPREQKVSSNELVERSHRRPARTDFKTRTTSGRLPLVLKRVVDPPVVANGGICSETGDYFTGSISVFNKSSASSTSIGEVEVYFRLVGDTTTTNNNSAYTPVESFKTTDILPTTLDPRQTWQMSFELVVPRSPSDVQLGVRWWNRAFVARKRPVRFKFVFRDVEEEEEEEAEASIVVEHVVEHFELDKWKQGEDLAFFYVDDPVFWERHSVHVSKRTDNDRDDVVLKIGGKGAVYGAIKSGETEVDIGVGEKKNVGDKNAWEWKAWALVDTSCRRVYAFKVFVTQRVDLVERTGMACLGYVLCPEYGDVMGEEARPVRYAEERVVFPDLEPIVDEEVVWEDGLDDVVEEPPSPPPPPPPAVNGGAHMELPPEVNARLASIDTNLERIANAFEQLLEMMKSQQQSQQPVQARRNAF
ncbi:hypothetical protein AAF712_009763 [Marasmius tenuissimus]|uniref:Alkyl hydroperoxide reductase subunit C/ Thiol specific antioxidant domain-containing protein n=1 Tax=Marasmius tenuissimus TaxID=585030 RepID=A0ABR2ZPN6_9AGAR